MPIGLPFELIDYLELIDLTGRCNREDKVGYIDGSQPKPLILLNISPKNWLALGKKFRSLFHCAVGNDNTMSDYYEHQSIKRRQNVSCCQRLFA